MAEALLKGMDTEEIAKSCGMANRTVKAYFNRMFRKAEIKNGIKRVKLAVILYNQFLEEERECLGTS